MNVLQVTMRDLVGKRFNGHQLHRRLPALGFGSEMLVIHKQGDDPAVHGLPRWAEPAELGLFVAERISSLQGMVSPLGLTFPLRGCFRRASLVHWHLVYPHYISLPLVPWLSRLKPTVWTLHDPWAATGHCIHPMDCTRWKTGCGHCPDLNRNFTVWFDTTRLVWNVKRAAYRRAALTLVVPSRWLKSVVEASPLLADFPCHVIPPGLDLGIWKRQDRAACRAKMGIPAGAKVLAFRMPTGKRQKVSKGIPTLIEALRRLELRQPTVLLAFEQRGQLAALSDTYTIIEPGWVDDEAWLAEALGATDVFIQPSLAETAPTMALEAMASGTPVVTSNTTAMPEMVRAPEAGVVVPPRDPEALARAIGRLLEDDALRAEMGAAGRRIVESEHSIETHVERHVALYQSVARGARSA